MNTEQSTSFLSRLNNWLRESVMVKLFSIAFLLLILLIPKEWVNSIIQERQIRLDEVMEEVSEKWSYAQDVTGPVLVIPYKKLETTRVMVNGKAEDRTTFTIEEAYFLPEKLDLKSNIQPQTLHRGLFDAVVYNSTTSMKGNFIKPNFAALNIQNDSILWNQAYIMLGLSDSRGIGQPPKFMVNNYECKTEPSTNNTSALFKSTVAGKVTVAANDTFIPFHIDLFLKGSSYLHVFPMGKSTQVNMIGNWGNPSFDGAYLPESRSISNDSFAATWNILHFNRPFPQQWLGQLTSLEATSLGVKLIIPVDQYQQSTRTSKYGVLLILLTFVSLLLIELIVKINIHPFQYSLIGVALVIFYSILLSFSEHIGFTWAYIISALATISLISTYAFSFIKSAKVTSLLSLLLFTFYTYIFIITQEQDYALLLGSIGLFIILAALMYVSRRIDWYNPKNKNEHSID